MATDSRREYDSHGGRASGLLCRIFHEISLVLSDRLPGALLRRMFFVTGGYHRYFSHRSFKTSRFFQFIIALIATMSTQKGVSGGPRIIAITTAIRIPKKTCIRRAGGFSVVAYRLDSIESL